jgi:ferredoxin
MNLVSLAQKFAEAADQRIEFSPDSCLHSKDRFSNCDLCYEICPAMAIQPGSPPSFDEEFCQSCRACLPACPTGAYSYSGIDTVQAICTNIDRQQLKSCDLCCELNPQTELGPRSSQAGLRVRGCLAGIGLGGFLMIFTHSLDRLSIRLDACDECPWSMLHPQIEERVDHSQRLLKLWGRADAIDKVRREDGIELTARPIWNAESPPRSRRELVQPGNSKISAAAEENNRYHERLRIIRAVGLLRSNPVEAESATSLEGLGFATLTIDDGCTACGTCARACPTEALVYEDTKFKFKLMFTPELCIGCEICEHVCVPQAISIDHTPKVSQVFGDDRGHLLYDGELAHCGKCRAPFSARPGSDLCPVCDFRRKNPFGSMIPPVARKHRQES